MKKMENFQSYGMVNSSSFQLSNFQQHFQQIPYSYPYFYQNQVQQQNTLNFISSTDYETDIEGKIVLKLHQCNQCFQLCHYEESLKYHINYCQKFSCPYTECRDFKYFSIYASKEEFKTKNDLSIHIKEKHRVINSVINSPNKSNQSEQITSDINNLLINLEETFENGNCVMTMACDDVKSKTHKYSQNPEKVERVEKQSDEIKELETKILKLQKDILQLKSENSKLLFKNTELELKLEERGTKANILVDNLQTILTSFYNTENTTKENDYIEDLFLNNTEKGKNETDQMESHDNILENFLVIEENKQETGKIITNDINLGARSKLYECDQCPQSFSLENRLLHHRKNHLSEEKSFKCDKCPKLFSAKSKLMEHSSFHDEKHPYNCAQCSNSFTKKTDLNKHIQAHTENKFCHMFNIS